MSVIWKGFTLDEIFRTLTGRDSTIAQKNLDKSTKKDDEYNIAIITESTTNNGVGFYMKESDPILKNKIVDKGLTFGTQFGNCNYHNYKHFIIGNTNYLEPISIKLQDLLDNEVGNFFALLVNYLFNKSGLFGFSNKINQESFYREIILLPTTEVNKMDEWIWSEEDKYYTLAVSFIQSMMDEAKKRREEKTIKFYESERLKYESERLKYESDYLKEQSSLIWKSFKLGDLFLESTEHYLVKSKKNYEISDTKDENFSVAVCAASKNNNGIVGYIQEIDDVPVKKRKGFLTKGGFGHVFYQADWFIKPGGSWGMLNILKIKNDALKLVLDQDILRYHFFARILTKIFTGMASWGYAVPLDREIILLPLIEVSRSENWIWNEDNKYFSLAVSTLSYLYLEGQINIQQRKIEEYSYKY